MDKTIPPEIAQRLKKNRKGNITCEPKAINFCEDCGKDIGGQHRICKAQVSNRVEKHWHIRCNICNLIQNPHTKKYEFNSWEDKQAYLKGENDNKDK